MEASSQTSPAASPKEETKMEKQSVRGAMCKLAEDVIAHRAQSNDASLIEAIIPDPHSDFVCVPASYLASLPEIVAFVPALDAAHREKFLVTVLTEFSEHLKANKDKEGKYIIRTEYRRNPQNTLIMHNVPAEAKESDLREVFLSIPTAASVSFKKDINSCWLATFDTEANAVATHSALFGQKIVVKDTTISIGLRTTRFVHVAQSSSAPATAPAAGQQATAIPAGSYNGMRAGFPPNMRQQQYFPQQYFMWMPQQPQYYQAMTQGRMGGQHQAGWQQQQKQRTGRGNGHSRYQNPAYQQQRAAPEQIAASGAPGAAAAATTAAAPAAAAAATSPAAAAPTTAPQQQQQAREGQRGGRGGRNRRYGRGGNRNHGNQAGAGSEAAPAGSAPKDHRSRQPASAAGGASERAEQPSKPQKKPTADSFPPLA